MLARLSQESELRENAKEKQAPIGNEQQMAAAILQQQQPLVQSSTPWLAQANAQAPLPSSAQPTELRGDSVGNQKGMNGQLTPVGSLPAKGVEIGDLKNLADVPGTPSSQELQAILAQSSPLNSQGKSQINSQLSSPLKLQENVKNSQNSQISILSQGSYPTRGAKASQESDGATQGLGTDAFLTLPQSAQATFDLSNQSFDDNPMGNGQPTLGPEKSVHGQAAHGGLSGHDFMNTLAGLKSPATQGLESALGSGSLSTQSLDKKKKPSEESSLVGAGLIGSGAPVRTAGLMQEMTANVTQGAGAKDRVTTESLMHVSGEIKNMAVKGGGEIRVRLRPDNLGELNIRVITNGSRVGIQIQTADEKSKKIIEDSMNFLKESLTAQKLTLSQVDLSVLSNSKPQDSSSQNPSQFSQQENWNMDSNQSRSQGGFENRNAWSQDSEGGSERIRGNYRGPQAVPMSLLASQAAAAHRARGGIDVTV